MKDEAEFIERRIVTGLIVSNDYHTRIQKIWNPDLLESPELSMLAQWSIDFHHAYSRAPGRDIQSIYMEKLQSDSISKADAEYIETLFQSLSDEYERDDKFNDAYLYDQTVRYFKSQELALHNQEMQALIETGRIEEAEYLAKSFSPAILDDADIGLDLATEEALARIDLAFSETGQSVVTYPGALGKLLNEQLIRGGFVSFLAPEKRGKSFLLMEISLRAIRQKANVAYFEAGDMTESQFLRRICIYLSRASDREEYCNERFRAVGDCIFNQLDTCDRSARNGSHGIYEGLSLSSYRSQMNQLATMDALKEQFEMYPDYETCKAYGCTARQGAVWIEKVPSIHPLVASRAKEMMQRFFQKHRRRYKLVNYPAGTLTLSEIRRCLKDWERHDGFVPDLIAIDYADLLASDDTRVSEFRHRQDHIWKGLRALSQERHALLITATQADADSYKKGRLSMSNFSEDKRKLAHVTAQYGLNQDPQGREKALGILRLNEIVVREGSFSADKEVHVIQDLAIGRPFLESY